MLTRMVSISGPHDPPASASQSAGITDLSHRALPEMGSYYITQTGLKLLDSSSPPAQPSQSVGITGMSYHTQSFQLLIW